MNKILRQIINVPKDVVETADKYIYHPVIKPIISTLTKPIATTTVENKQNTQVKNIKNITINKNSKTIVVTPPKDDRERDLRLYLLGYYKAKNEDHCPICSLWGYLKGLSTMNKRHNKKYDVKNEAKKEIKESLKNNLVKNKNMPKDPFSRVYSPTKGELDPNDPPKGGSGFTK